MTLLLEERPGDHADGQGGDGAARSSAAGGTGVNGSLIVGDREALLREARLVGLGAVKIPTLESVERRRLQLWLLSTFILVGATIAVAVTALHPSALDGTGAAWNQLKAVRIPLLVLIIVFVAYVMEKEVHLRRLTRLLVDERVLTAALSNRLQEVGALLEAGKAINSVLELDAVLEIILNSALELLRGVSGSIMLLEGRDRLHAACVRGNEAAVDAIVPFDQGIAGRVARSREPLLITGRKGARVHPVESAMCVPLLYRGGLLGVLNINGDAARSFTEHDLRALALFAEHAATAIGNARLYEAERLHVAELVEMEGRKTEFLAAVSHDLRTPLTSLIGCTKMLQRERLPEDTRLELAAMVDRQSQRLKRMIDELLAAARLEAAAPPELVDVDIAGLAREVAAEYLASDRKVEVDAPDGEVFVRGTLESLRRALTNLVDNAFAYGAPPVVITVAADADHASAVLVSVVDHGTGIARADRERVFERFCRLDANRRQSGVGLGLSIVRGLVAGCSGHVWADAADTGGAAFHIRLTTP